MMKMKPIKGLSDFVVLVGFLMRYQWSKCLFKLGFVRVDAI